MKKVLFSFIILFTVLHLNSQNFSTGFDTDDEQTAWTEYRMLGQTSANWGFGQGQSVSAPYCLSHDYPMGEDVEDWLVSPALFLSQSNSSISLSSYKVALSAPPDIYYGVWVSYGSPDPADGDYIEIADFTSFPSVESTWDDTTVSFNSTIDSCYFAIKYAALDFYWLMICIDDIIIENANLLSIPSDEISSLEQGLVSPNPASDFITINGIGEFDVELMNISGQKLSQHYYSVDNQNNSIDISKLSPGVYFLLKKNGHKFTSHKFIKE